MTTIRVGLAADSPTSGYETDGTDDDVQINAAIAASSADDIILLVSATYTIDDEITMDTGLTLQGTGKLTTTVIISGGTFAGVRMVYALSKSNVTIKDLTLDGFVSSVPGDTKAVAFDTVTNAVMSDVRIHNSAGDMVTIGGVTGGTFTDITCSRDSIVPPGISHGFDIDENGSSLFSSDIVIIRMDNTNLEDESLKVEHCTTCTVTDSTFNSLVVIGDTTAAGGGEATGISFTDCTFDAVVIANGVDSNDVNLTDCIFTQNGGAILVEHDDINLILTRCTFYGRNSWLGFDRVASPDVWATRTNVTEIDCTHPGAADEAGKSMFYDGEASHSQSDTVPWITPNTAEISLRDLTLNASLGEDDMHYCVVSTVVQDSDITSSRLYAWRSIVEGYPDRATIDISNRTVGDLFTSTNATKGTTIRNLQFTGTASAAGLQIARFSSASFVDIVDCIYDSLISGGTLGMALDAIDTTTVRMIDCTLSNNTGTGSDGSLVIMGDGTDSNTCELIGCRFIDNTCKTGVIRAKNNSTANNIIGCEFIRNIGSGNTGAVFAQGTTTSVDGCTFVGNTGATGANDITSAVALTINNSIFEASADIGGGGTITLIGCMVGDANTHTDGGNNQFSTTPTYVDAGNDDYNLTSGSDGVGDGVKWWGTGPRPHGSGGEPYPDTKIDVGGIQSTWDADHPANL